MQHWKRAKRCDIWYDTRTQYNKRDFGLNGNAIRIQIKQISILTKMSENIGIFIKIIILNTN